MYSIPIKTYVTIKAIKAITGSYVLSDYFKIKAKAKVYVVPIKTKGTIKDYASYGLYTVFYFTDTFNLIGMVCLCVVRTG